MSVASIDDLAQAAASGCVRLCIGHKASSISLPPDTFYLTPNAELAYWAATRAFYIPDVDPDTSLDHSTLSEYRQLFGFASTGGFLAQSDTWLSIIQYRKFLSSRGGEKVAAAMPYLYECSPVEASEIFATQSPHGVTAALERETIGPIVSFGSSAVVSYCKYHVGEDFGRFLLSMQESGLFSRGAMCAFMDTPYMIPSPCVGVFRARDFFSDLQVLQRVWKIFRDHYFIARAGYQRRVGGFLLERLHSFLLLQRALALPTNFRPAHGHQFVVSTTESPARASL